MNKKGVSPLLATVFLVAATLLVAALVFTANLGNTVDLLDQQDQRIAEAQLSLLKFSAEWPSKADCESVCTGEDKSKIACYDPSAENGDLKCYCLLIGNEENEPVSYSVLTKGPAGAEICSPDNFKLNPFESKIFYIAVHRSIVGDFNEDNKLTADVSAVLVG